MITSLSIDLLIRIKNGYRATRSNISAVNSKFCRNICDILKTHKYIKNYSISEDKKTLDIELSYQNNFPAVTDVKIFSKPGRRFYSKHFSLPWGKTRESLIIISTSQGLLSQRSASSKKIGGEIIAEIF